MIVIFFISRLLLWMGLWPSLAQLVLFCPADIASALRLCSVAWLYTCFLDFTCGRSLLLFHSWCASGSPGPAYGLLFGLHVNACPATLVSCATTTLLFKGVLWILLPIVTLHLFAYHILFLSLCGCSTLTINCYTIDFLLSIVDSIQKCSVGIAGVAVLIYRNIWVLKYFQTKIFIPPPLFDSSVF